MLCSSTISISKASPAMPFYARKLTAVLSERLPDWHRARIKFIARYVGSLLKLTTTNGKKIALALNPQVQSSSNYRRIQRFMSGFAFDFLAFGRFLLRLLPQKSGFVVVMDRTEWHFGSRSVNVLMVGFAYKGIAFPVLWDVLSKEGSSSTEERKALFERFLRLVEPEEIHAFVADREFIGSGWLGFLSDRDVPFVIRIRSNRGVALGSPGGPALPARMFFRSCPRGGGVHRLEGEQRFVGGQPVSVVGKRLHGEDEFLVLVASPGVAAEQAPRLYRQRWEIETLFAAMKSRGFDLEATHMTAPEHVSRLIGLLSLAFVWSHLVGQWRSEQRPVRVKKHGWPEQSLFRYGLDLLQSVMLNLTEKKDEFRRCLSVLTDPPKSFVV